MSDQITYEDKADLIVDTTIDDTFKVSASDMNEIKNVVNSHADDIDVANNNITDLNNNKLDADAVLNQASTDTDKTYSADYLNDKLVSVGAEEPTDGRRVWFENGGKNLLNIKGIVKGRLDSGAIGYESNVTSLVLNDNSFSFTTNVNYRGVTSAYIKTSTNLTLSATNSINDYGTAVACYDENKNFISNATYTQGTNYKNIVVANGTKYIRVYFYLATAGTITIANPMLEEGSTATTYEPYVAPSINVDEEEIFNKNTFDQNTSLITEYGNRMTLWGCEELGEKQTGYDANDCLPGQSFFWSVGQTPTNVPSGVQGGRIYCFKGYASSGRFQFCFNYPTNVTRIYFRNYFAGTWGVWKYITLTNV